MFDTLTESFTSAIRKIRFHDDEKALTKALGELKKALLKADVHHKVVKELIDAVKLQTKQSGIGKDQFTVARWALARGGHVRTGLEDNVRLDRDRLAPSNAALVRRVVELCDRYERPVADWRTARSILGLRQPQG